MINLSEHPEGLVAVYDTLISNFEEAKKHYETEKNKEPDRKIKIGERNLEIRFNFKSRNSILKKFKTSPEAIYLSILKSGTEGELDIETAFELAYIGLNWSKNTKLKTINQKITLEEIETNIGADLDEITSIITKILGVFSKDYNMHKRIFDMCKKKLDDFEQDIINEKVEKELSEEGKKLLKALKSLSLSLKNR